MGNRVYVTLKGKGKSKTYYLHWNGGLDTWCPLVKVLFENNIKSPEEVVSLLQSLDIRSEVQTDKNAQEWTEENGHYFIDLVNKSFRVKSEDGSNECISDMKRGFEEYLINHILENYREQVRKEYWVNLIESGEKFFSKKRAV